MMKKNLVIIPALYVNSKILAGLLDYLSRWFNVYFIDLPGFTKRLPCNYEVSFKYYAGFVENEIKKLNLDNYILCGMSFGFGVISEMRLDDKCRGILALEPYVGSSAMKKGVFEKLSSKVFTSSKLALAFADLLWKSPLSGISNRVFIKLPAYILKLVQEELDPKTMLKASYLVLTYKETINFHNLPHVLVANENDNTINYQYMENLFKHKVESLLILHTDINHFPEDISPQYFESHMSTQTLDSVVDFF